MVTCFNLILGEVTLKSSSATVNDQANEVSLGVIYFHLISKPDMTLDTEIPIDVKMVIYENP